MRRWISAGWKSSCGLWGVLLSAACAASSAPEPLAASALEPGLATPQEEGEATPPPAPGARVTAGEPAAPEAAALEAAAPAAPAASGAQPAPGEASQSGSGAGMIEFFEVGRGDRVADLGGMSGYSLAPVRRAVGPAGVVYVRRQSPPPDASSASDDLARLVWMKTSDEAPLTADATRLNAVTLLFGYHAVVAAGHDRRKLNAAVYSALVPGGVYIIADRAAPPGSGLGAARRDSSIEDGIVRAEVQAAGFQFVEAADFVSSVARSDEGSSAGQYVLKFKKPK